MVKKLALKSRQWFLLLAALVVFAQPFALSAAAQETPKAVLVLHSYHQGLEWTDSISRGIVSTLGKNAHPVTVQFEYMDTKRIADDQHLENLAKLLQHKYSKHRFDVLITSDNSAFDFLLRHQQDIFPRTPIVFCGVNDFQHQSIADNPFITGVAESISLKETLDGALQIDPAVERVFVIVDDTDTQKTIKHQLDGLIPLYGNRIRFEYLTHLTMKEMQERTHTLPQHSIVLLLGFTRDSQGMLFSAEESAALISQSSIRPIYSVWDFYLNHGIIGGKLTTGIAHGEKAAELALRILAGENPRSIPVVEESPNRYLFDYRVLNKFNIDRQRLPDGSLVINEPMSLYSQYGNIIWQVGAAFLALLLVTVFIAANLIKRRVAEASLQKSEQRLRAIFQAAADISFIITDGVDANPQVLEFSPGAEKIFGYSRNEIIGKSVAILHLPEDIQHFPQAHEQMRQGETGFSGETTLVRKNGEHFPALFSTYPLLNEHGEMWGALGVSVDMTSQKQVESALRESEERFKELAQLLPETIYEMDLSGNILFLNQSGFVQFLFTAEDFERGLNAFDFFPPSEHEKLQKNLAILASGKPSGLNEYVVKRKDGKEMPVMARSSPIIKAGEIIGLRGFLIDISEKKQLEEQFQFAQRMESIGTLAGGIAHDFNNLLMGIQGFSSLTQMGLAPDHPSRKLLQKIDACVVSATGLTRQLLGFAKGGKYDVKATDLNDMIEKTAEMFGRTKKELQIVQQLDRGLWAVAVDRGQIEQVLLNLMINAWQAMPEGGNLTIASCNHTLMKQDPELPSLAPGRYVVITMTDTGFGMDQQTRNKIFEPFFTTKAKGFGTGLGLASTYGIVSNHKGGIKVQSEPGKGATFSIYLPASDATPPPVTLSPEQLLHGQATILLIDDETLITEVESEILTNLGYSVHICNNGHDALEYYRNNYQQIDLVILDIIMPGMSGEETFIGLQAINPDIKVILASGYSLEGQAEKILHMGCKGFIQKPFTHSLLSLKIQEVLQIGTVQ